MAEGRGGAMVGVAVLVLLMVSLQFEVADAVRVDTVVGGLQGWTMNVAGWEKGRTFYFGEGLAFNYPQGQHNVVVTNKTGYDTCRAGPKDAVYTSGKDGIPLRKGENYFICNFTGHCASMKIKVTAEVRT